MRATFHREGLLSAVQLASAAVAARDVKPILRQIKAVVDADRCVLMATDAEQGLRLTLRGVVVEEAGEAILPTARLLAILRESSDDTLLLDANQDRCLLTGRHNEFEMPSEDPAPFPDVPEFPSKEYHELAAGTLREMIRRTIFATGENTRYAMDGVLWELEGEEARLVATDGRRLAVVVDKAVAHGGHSPAKQSHVVPTKAMSLLERLLLDPEEKVRVCLRPNDAAFHVERATLTSRLAEGRYPPYREIFPKKREVRVPLLAGPLLAAVRQAAIMTDNESKKVAFAFTQGLLTLSARGVDAGRSKVELPIEYDGKPLTVYFDPKYLQDMLKVLPPEAPVTLDLIDGSTPALFKSGESYSYVVMPLS